MQKSAFFCSNPSQIDRVYGKGRRDMITRAADCYSEIITPENFEKHSDNLQEIEAVFSTWGMWSLSEDQLQTLPSLEIVLYAAGSVKGFAGVLLDKGIRVVSAWGANAVPVAEFTVAQIILSNKCYFENSRNFTLPAGKRLFEPRGNFGATVVLLGAGMIGRKVISLLDPYNLDIAVWDPFLDEEYAETELNVRKIKDLTDAFSQGHVVSNHLANVPETVGLLTGTQFAAMREHATFINTGRGATVREPELIKVFTDRSDLTALLDVTYPEPPEENSPLYTLPNIQLSGHIAGSLGNEVIRMADYMMEEHRKWKAGEQLQYEVTHAMLETMA